MATVKWQIQPGSVKRDDRKGGYLAYIGFQLSDDTVIPPKTIFVPYSTPAKMKACVDRIALKLEKQHNPIGPQPTDELAAYEGVTYEVEVPQE